MIEVCNLTPLFRAFKNRNIDLLLHCKINSNTTVTTKYELEEPVSNVCEMPMSDIQILGALFINFKNIPAKTFLQYNKKSIRKLLTGKNPYIASFTPTMALAPC